MKGQEEGREEAEATKERRSEVVEAGGAELAVEAVVDWCSQIRRPSAPA